MVFLEVFCLSLVCVFVVEAFVVVDSSSRRRVDRDQASTLDTEFVLAGLICLAVGSWSGTVAAFMVDHVTQSLGYGTVVHLRPGVTGEDMFLTASAAAAGWGLTAFSLRAVPFVEALRDGDRGTEASRRAAVHSVTTTPTAMGFLFLIARLLQVHV